MLSSICMMLRQNLYSQGLLAPGRLQGCRENASNALAVPWSLPWTFHIPVLLESCLLACPTSGSPFSLWVPEGLLPQIPKDSSIMMSHGP